MKKLQIIICILLQATMFCCASEEKKLVLSSEDDAWLGNNLNIFLSSQSPQVFIASFISGAITHVDLINKGMPYLQKNIDHAKNWLSYFNERKALSTEDQLEFCKELNDSARFIERLGGERDFETKVFLELLSLGMDIKKIGLSQENNFFTSFIKKLSPEFNIAHYANIMNGLIYFYQPSLAAQEEEDYWLPLILTNRGERSLGSNGLLEDVFAPTFYELTDDKVIRSTYKDVQQDIDCKKRFAEAFLLALKAKIIIIPRPVREGLILKQAGISTQEFASRYKSVQEFNAYCNHVENEICNQIEWMQKNRSEIYQNNVIFLSSLKTRESFKEWYGTLKYPKENL